MSPLDKKDVLSESRTILIPQTPESISELVNPLSFEIPSDCGPRSEVLEFEKSPFNRGIRLLSTVEILFSCLVLFCQISLCQETFLAFHLSSNFKSKGPVPFLLISGLGFYSPIVLFIPAAFFTLSVAKWKSHQSQSYKKLVATAFGLQALSALFACAIIAFSSMGRLQYLAYDYDYEYSVQGAKLLMFCTSEIISSLIVVLSSCSLMGTLFHLLNLHKPTEETFLL